MPERGPVPDDIDRALTAAAYAAKQGDLASQNALYSALEPRVHRVVRRCAAYVGCRRGGVVEPDDIAQEAFLVFLTVLDRWPARGSFVAYFLAAFPHDLRHAARDLIAARARQISLDAAASATLLDDGTVAAAEAAMLLEQLADRLGEPFGTMLLRRVRDGACMAVIARELGMSRRSLQRHWSALLDNLRRLLEAGD
jgi:RNA polymerase sigma factor (sigma-70 family)